MKIGFPIEKDYEQKDAQHKHPSGETELYILALFVRHDTSVPVESDIFGFMAV